MLSPFIKSPFNYIGGKFRLLKQIVPNFPQQMNSFVDLFCGGGNVGINVNARRVLFNDANSYLYGLYKLFREENEDYIFDSIFAVIKSFELSDTAEYGYESYHCKSNTGLQQYNRSRYIKLRTHFNELTVRDYSYYIILYVLIMYGFNNQIRFNGRGEFNIPVGKRDFNEHMQKKLSAFIMRLKEIDCVFSYSDFREVDIERIGSNAFVYADPPYLITQATYNERGGWAYQDEEDLLIYLDRLNNMGISFALSNVLSNKGKKNTILSDWVAKRGYFVINLNHSYGNSNYQTKDKISKPEEVLIVNYRK